MENSVIQEFNADADRIIANKLLPAKSRQRYEQVYNNKQMDFEIYNK